MKGSTNVTQPVAKTQRKVARTSNGASNAKAKRTAAKRATPVRKSAKPAVRPASKSGGRSGSTVVTKPRTQVTSSTAPEVDLVTFHTENLNRSINDEIRFERLVISHNDTVLALRASIALNVALALLLAVSVWG